MIVDQATVAQLYERYGHALYRRCFNLLRSEQDARELVQEVFYQFWRDRARFAGRSAVFTYLYRIATNLSIDRLRRRTTAGVQMPIDGVTVRAAGDVASRPEALSMLVRLTEGLDEETLTVAVMSHVDGLTQEEIAAALDLSRRTVGKRLKNFLKHTRGRLEATPGGPQTAAPAARRSGTST